MTCLPRADLLRMAGHLERGPLAEGNEIRLRSVGLNDGLLDLDPLRDTTICHPVSAAGDAISPLARL